MKIKTKIITGFVLIILLLLLAGVMSIYEFSRIRESVSSLIDDNYKSIEACKVMTEAVEREDSGILLYISGKSEEGKSIILSGDSTFNFAFNIAEKNITEKGEPEKIDQLKNAYSNYKNSWMPLLFDEKLKSNLNINLYFADIDTNFLLLKKEIRDLQKLNEESMYGEVMNLKSQTYRTIMPAIVAIILALIILFMFNFFISKFFVKPMNRLIQSAKNYPSSCIKNFDAEILTKDEFKQLESEIQNLIQRIKNK